jgi:hypothetical protein
VRTFNQRVGTPKAPKVDSEHRSQLLDSAHQSFVEEYYQTVSTAFDRSLKLAKYEYF